MTRKVTVAGSRIFALAVLAVGFPRISVAFVDPPTLIPSNPVVNEAVFVRFRAGVCDVILQPDQPGANHSLTQVENTIRLRVDSYHYSDPFECLFPAHLASFPIGSFAAGNYQVEVERRYDLLVGPVVQPLGTFSMIIVEGGPSTITQIPTLGTWGIISLAGFLILIVWVMRQGKIGSLLIFAVSLLSVT